MTITLTYSKKAYYKAIFARFCRALQAAKVAFYREIQNHEIHKPVNYEDFIRAKYH